MFKPERFEPQDFIHEKTTLGRAAVVDQGRQIVEKAFANLDSQLEGKTYATGEQFSIADAALFYVERWAPLKGIDLPPTVSKHYEMLLARPSVQKVRAIWGES